MLDPSPEKLCDICKGLHHKGFLAAADGNVSFMQDGVVFITPSGVAKNTVCGDALAQVELSGGVVQGNPSSESRMHLAVYNHCEKARAVVHAHPPHAIALSIARPDWTWLPQGAMSELVLALGAVPVVPYARPSTAAMGENLVPFLPKCRAMILSRHGVLCWGETLEEAYHGVERLEHTAQILCLALQLGPLSELPVEEIAALKTMRQTLGEKIR